MKETNSKITLVQSAMYYGIFLGTFLLVRFVVAIYAVDAIFLSLLLLLLTAFIPFVAYILAIQYKKSLPNQYISYYQVYIYTFFLFVFGSLILSIAQYVFYQFISPDFLFHQYQLLLDKSELVMTEIPQMGTFLEDFKKQGVPTAIAVSSQNVWIYSFFGMMIGLVLGFIVRTKQKPQA